MKPNELRIGNWVEQPNDGVTKVTAILNDLQIKTETGYVDKYCRPIPLTEEWLLKFGFEKGRKNNFQICTVNIDKNVFSLDNGICIIKDDIKYLHQLQNLYFALTGEELTLKEKQDA